MKKLFSKFKRATRSKNIKSSDAAYISNDKTAIQDLDYLEFNREGNGKMKIKSFSSEFLKQLEKESDSNLSIIAFISIDEVVELQNVKFKETNLTKETTFTFDKLENL